MKMRCYTHMINIKRSVDKCNYYDDTIYHHDRLNDNLRCKEKCKYDVEPKEYFLNVIINRCVKTGMISFIDTILTWSRDAYHYPTIIKERTVSPHGEILFEIDFRKGGFHL